MNRQGGNGGHRGYPIGGVPQQMAPPALSYVQQQQLFQMQQAQQQYQQQQQQLMQQHLLRQHQQAQQQQQIPQQQQQVPPQQQQISQMQRPQWQSASPDPSPAVRLPSLSLSPMIQDVWADNLEEEFAKIRELLPDYPYVAMDTEFPGTVAKAVGVFKYPHEFYYQMLRCNVDMLKLIQIGLTLLNERGEAPEERCTWQFNFQFSLSDDIYAMESIRLLQSGGIDFSHFATVGIDRSRFAALLISSGMVLNPSVTWVAFHSGFDFAYLIKVLSGDKELPEKEEDFLRLFHLIFPSAYDLKYLLRFDPQQSHAIGLDALALALKLRRYGTAHQSGSDSLLTGHCFFRLLRDTFHAVPTQHAGVIYALSEDESSHTATPATTLAAQQQQPFPTSQQRGGRH